MHCADPGCLAACPAPGAIVQYANGIVDFDQDQCIGCGLCMSGCPFDVPKFKPETRRVYKCTMCVDRTSVGLQPACVKACPTSCLQFGTKDAMLEVAKHRVDQLKADGFAQAAVYDPAGVGGTSVVTVLAFGDRPELYGLPRNPTVPAAMSFFTGALRRMGGLAMVAGLVIAAIHYLRYGPKHDDPPRRESGEPA
jgi:formate dehydrogenase beta subunit